MAWTEAERDALRAAIAKGEQSVAFGGRTVSYRSLDDMLRALALIEAELAAAAAPPRPRRWLCWGAKGTT